MRQYVEREISQDKEISWIDENTWNSVVVRPATDGLCWRGYLQQINCPLSTYEVLGIPEKDFETMAGTELGMAARILDLLDPPESDDLIDSSWCLEVKDIYFK